MPLTGRAWHFLLDNERLGTYFFSSQRFSMHRLMALPAFVGFLYKLKSHSKITVLRHCPLLQQMTRGNTAFASISLRNLFVRVCCVLIYQHGEYIEIFKYLNNLNQLFRTMITNGFSKNQEKWLYTDFCYTLTLSSIFWGYVKCSVFVDERYVQLW